MALKKLSELEGVCLGILSKFQPCTTYRVRCILRESLSSTWRASAGSVYPLLARLEERKFINAKRDESDGRGKKLLSLTSGGRASLKKWILAGTESDVIAATSDPLRTRLFFLDALSSHQREQYLEQLVLQMEHYLEETRQWLKQIQKNEDIYGFLGSKGAAMATQSRLEWLIQVRDDLKGTGH